MKAVIKSIQDEFTIEIQTISNDVIKSLKPGKNTNSEASTSNILKMLELTQNTITESSIQEILNNNLNDPLVTSVVLSIAQSKNLSIDKPVDMSKLIQDTTNKLMWLD